MNAEFIEIVKRNNFVVLDTETTGLNRPAEICQIAIVDQDGVVLLDTLVKTKLPIPPGATAIHGITDADVAGAPSWPAVAFEVAAHLMRRDVIVYNAKFDRNMMHLSDEAWNLPHTAWKEIGAWHCAMEAYARYHGEIHPYYGSFVWQKLSVACRIEGLPVIDAHHAVGDALMTCQLVKYVTSKLIASQPEKPKQPPTL